MPDDWVWALVSGGTLDPALRRVLVLRLLMGFTLLRMEATQSLMPAEKYFLLLLEVESLRK